MTKMVVVPTQIISYANFVEAKTANPGKAAMEFAKAKLNASIRSWHNNLPRLRHDAESANEHREWISEAEEQVQQIQHWLTVPLELSEFTRQLRAYDIAHKTNLYGQIFERAPILN